MGLNYCLVHDGIKTLLGYNTWIVESMAEMKNAGSELRAQNNGRDIGSGECVSPIQSISKVHTEFLARSKSTAQSMADQNVNQICLDNSVFHKPVMSQSSISSIIHGY